MGVYYSCNSVRVAKLISNFIITNKISYKSFHQFNCPYNAYHMPPSSQISLWLSFFRLLHLMYIYSGTAK